jgi:hypothetical protein
MEMHGQLLRGFAAYSFREWIEHAARLGMLFLTGCFSPPPFSPRETQDQNSSFDTSDNETLGFS